jgi:hypothetical protein
VATAHLGAGNSTTNNRSRTSAAFRPRSTDDTVVNLGDGGLNYHRYQNNGNAYATDSIPKVKRGGLSGIAVKGNVTPGNSTSAS